MSNTKNTICSLKKLLGKRFASEAIQAELPFATYSIVNVAGEARIQFQYNDEQHTWRVERAMAMMLHHMRQIAELGNDGKAIVDCVVSVPPYWTDAERVAMLQSCEICGLNVLKLMNDSSAAALNYGIYKTDLPEESAARNVMIFDLGHGDLTVQIVSFSKGKFVVKAIASDLIGTRGLDMLIARHCQKVWQDKHKIDAFQSPKTVFRLLGAAEKLRKTLSSIPKSSLSIECFIDDIDVSMQVERPDLEEWAQPWLAKLQATVTRCFELAGMSPDDLFSCEVIGGGSRIPCVGSTLKEMLGGREVSRTLNAEEAVAKGLALQGAMLSPAFKVRDFSINEVSLYPINIAWGSSADAKDGAVDMDTDEAAAAGGVVESVGGASRPGSDGSEIFKRLNPMPSSKMLTLYRSATFHLNASYPPDAACPPGTQSKIADFVVSGLPLPKAPADAKTKVKVKVRLDENGILNVESAQAIEEKEVEVWEDAPKEELIADTKTGGTYATTGRLSQPDPNKPARAKKAAKPAPKRGGRGGKAIKRKAEEEGEAEESPTEPDAEPSPSKRTRKKQ
jgi:heat shock protein 4